MFVGVLRPIDSYGHSESNGQNGKNDLCQMRHEIVQRKHLLNELKFFKDDIDIIISVNTTRKYTIVSKCLVPRSESIRYAVFNF